MLRNSNEGVGIVVAVTFRSEAAPTFNLTVEDLSTFFVDDGGGDVLVHNANMSDPIPNIPTSVIQEYDNINLGRGTPRIDPKTGAPTVHRGTDVMRGSAARSYWAGSLEFDVPGTNHRILRTREGRMGYVLNHDYSKIKPFPAPWFPDGGC